MPSRLLGILLAGNLAAGLAHASSAHATTSGDGHGTSPGAPAPDSATIRLPAAFVKFGAAVAVAGDELLVGRPSTAARRGSPVGGVHLFGRGADGRWAERAVLAPADLARGDDFGAALAVDSAAGLLAVGAPGGREGRGAVYLFVRTAQGGWARRAKLVAAAGAPGDRFGAALAVRGGLLLVGAPGHAAYRGRVVAFRRGAGGAWTEAGTLESGDTSHMAFGEALALAEGYVYIGAAGPPLLPGLQLEPDAAPRVFVYRDSAGTLTAKSQLPLADSGSTPDLNSKFGVALVADGADLLVASPGAEAVFHFRRDRAGIWTQQQRIVADSTSSAASFGIALVRAGRELLIGAPRTKGDTGAIFVFRYDSAAGRWSQVQRIDPEKGSIGHAPVPSQNFGGMIAAAGSLAIAGVPNIDNSEGVAVALRRTSGGRWQSAGILADSAWTTRQQRVGRAVPCSGGHALVFDCHNADLVAFLPLSAIGGDKPGHESTLSGLWGWTDSATGREFALVGRSDATAFVEVTDPARPRYLGELPLHAGAEPSEWRDMKVYKNHAFVVSEGGGGVQVFDLTQLRAVKGAPVVFQETGHYDRIARAHTLAVDPASGFLYAAGSNSGGETCGGGLHIIDARTPATLTFAGCFADTIKAGDRTGSYVHETACQVYQGPDAHYRGREICLNSTGSALVAVDVTDKRQPKVLSVATYPSLMYAHQGWLSEDQRYFFLNDELDEKAELQKLGLAGFTQIHTRTVVFDLTDLTDPVVTKEFYGTTGATDHNLYVRGRYMYQANYRAGLRVIDVVDPKSPQEVGYFDIAPAFDNTPGMWRGAWTNYPYFKSGVVAVTGITDGLFLIRFRPGATPTSGATGKAP